MLMWGPPNVTPVHLWSFKQFLLWSGLKRRKKSIIISEIRNHMTNFLYIKKIQGASVCTKISWKLLLGVQFEALNTTMAIFWQNSKVWIAKGILLQGVLNTNGSPWTNDQAPITGLFLLIQQILIIPKTYDARIL